MSFFPGKDPAPGDKFACEALKHVIVPRTSDLGDGFTDRFAADAARRPPPASGGALADGLAFARALARQGRLPGDTRVEAQAAAARLSRSPARLAATLAGPPRRLVIVIRAPGLGDRWLSLPLP